MTNARFAHPVEEEIVRVFDELHAVRAQPMSLAARGATE
jgi:hypothetical protein